MHTLIIGILLMMCSDANVMSMGGCPAASINIGNVRGIFIGPPKKHKEFPSSGKGMPAPHPAEAFDNMLC